MSTATTTDRVVSLDAARARSRTGRSTPAPLNLPASDAHPLVGAVAGAITRRYGLMASEELVCVTAVHATSGDLAVADRLAFVEAVRSCESVLVVEHDGWYVACSVNVPLDAQQLSAIASVGPDAPRVMSLVTPRGIMPSLGPLGAEATADLG